MVRIRHYIKDVLLVYDLNILHLYYSDNTTLQASTK
jgi:hypothetical protein